MSQRWFCAFALPILAGLLVATCEMPCALPVLRSWNCRSPCWVCWICILGILLDSGIAVGVLLECLWQDPSCACPPCVTVMETPSLRQCHLLAGASMDSRIYCWNAYCWSAYGSTGDAPYFSCVTVTETPALSTPCWLFCWTSSGQLVA